MFKTLNLKPPGQIIIDDFFLKSQYFKKFFCKILDYLNISENPFVKSWIISIFQCF